MRNKIKASIKGLAGQATLAANGLQQHGAAIGLEVVTSVALTAEATALTAADAVCDREKSELSKRKQAVRTLLKNGAGFLRLCRETLKPYLGTKYSVAWVEASFDGSLQVARDVDGILQMLAKMATYLLAHPTQENAQLGVEASRATTFHTDITNARTAVANQRTVLDQALTVRDGKMDSVTVMMADLIKDMTIHMTPLDDRWPSFGLNKPGLKATPDVPTNIVALLIGPSSIAMKWNKAARAEHYRVWKRVVGVDDELIFVGSPADLDFALEGLPAGATIELAVSAVNNGGESQKSAVVTVVTVA